jgi:2-oxoglutarate dehydrogenase E1 component
MFDFIARENPEYVDALYREYRRDPRAVDERWAFVFSAYELGLAHGAGGVTGPEVGNLVHSYRDLGHLIADLDRQHPLLRLEEFGIREADLRVDECEGFRGWGRVTLRELLAALRDTYCRTLGVEYMGIPDRERRDSLQDRMEPSRNHPALSPDQRRRILERLIAAEGFVTATRFSLKGGEALMPLLDTVVEEAGGLGAQELVLDIPHRGRLNVLAHVRGKPYEMLLAEFEGSFLLSDVHGDGDVK